MARVDLAVHLGDLGQVQADEGRCARGRPAASRNASVVGRDVGGHEPLHAQPAGVDGRERRAAQHVERQRAVVERARERPDVVERGRERPQAVGRHAAERGLEAGDAAGRRRQADRGAGVGPEPERAQPGRERAGVAARGAARDAIGPRAVDDGAVGAVARRHAPGELVQVGLAEHDRAGVEQPPHARRRAHRDVVAEDARAVGRAHARRVEDVLDEQRHACERPGRTSRARARARDSPVTVMTVCRCSCSAMRVEVVPRDLLGGELARRDRGGDPPGRPCVKVAPSAAARY